MTRRARLPRGLCSDSFKGAHYQLPRLIDNGNETIVNGGQPNQAGLGSLASEDNAMTHGQSSMKGVDGRLAWATLAVLGSTWALLAQTPTFRSTIDIVQVDVSVLDRNRSPVRDLKAADFTILVDDRPQPVAVFAAIDIPDPSSRAGGERPTCDVDARRRAGRADESDCR